MKIQPVTANQNTYKSKTVIPKSSRFVEIQKREFIDELKATHIADVFKKFEENLRTTMDTFIYMIQH